jgi:hypothetical protein
MIKKISEPQARAMSIPPLLVMTRVEVILPSAAHARERLAGHRVHAMRQPRRPAVDRQRRAARVAHSDPERLTVIPQAIQAQPAVGIVCRPERAPYMSTVMDKVRSTVP